MFDYRRTHSCGELKAGDIGKEITLSGWVHRWRDHGGLIFIDLRDRFGLTQLVFDPKVNNNNHNIAEKLRAEWVISIKGIVNARAEGMANSNLTTGEIEIEVRELEVLSEAKTPPFSISDENITVNEELRLKHRYLDIRRGEISDNLIVRHKAMMSVRRFLDEKGFLEITTPILGKSTPEGARDYLVPSRVQPGSFYALPQSPQLFKQLLMVSGMDKYFQLATCFRDEDLRASRQPEFTQIDIEMSFSMIEDLFSVVEDLTQRVFKECIGVDIPTPFPHLTYKESMEKYGSDKPDLRFAMELVGLNDIAERSDFGVFKDQIKSGSVVKGLCVKGGKDISRKGIDDYTKFVAKFGVKGLAWMKMQDSGLSSSIVKFFSPELQEELIKRMGIEEGDLIFMIADSVDCANQSLDHLRRRIADDRGLITKGTYNFTWVTEFPLFEWDADGQRLSSMHHPFTSPHVDDIELLETKPLEVRSSGYDLVLNGHEIAGGSQRIHSSELQEKIFSALKLSEEDIQSKFGFFVEALKYGTPPHLGIAFGFDRLNMILSGTENIRDVIAFPKTQRATDLMTEAPSHVSKDQLSELRIEVEKAEEWSGAL
ncbi:MAG: aspartyl-tRNA synthetase [Chlamydiales bacterium]|jgi:aspartyl-tRNA synthetase